MESLKNCYNDAFFDKLTTLIKPLDSGFDGPSFVASVFNEAWDDYELKQRMRHITLCLNKHLSGNFSDKIETLKPVSEHFDSYDALFFSDFVEQFGLDEYDISIEAMHHFTQFCTAEFAVRPFIEKYPKKMMAQMAAWSLSDNYHVRRLASEGCRPRLPWASALAKFKKDPSDILPILNQLKEDTTDYVRRSVANNLNDISKDHPDIVVEIAKQWKGHNKDTDWIVKHACRGLLKSAHPEIMSLYGYSVPKNMSVDDFECTKSLSIGESITFSFKLNSTETIGLCRLEFALYFMKANKKQARKVFKISESFIDDSSKPFEKHFSLQPRTTRKLYAGTHSLAIVVNGFEFEKRDFELMNS